jgi:hypothetical protein
MTLKLQIINPLEFNGWDELLLSYKEICFSHSRAWAKIIHETFGCNPMYFCNFNGQRINVLVPVMEINSKLTGRRGVSLPYTHICEPIFDKNAKFNEVLDTIISHGKRYHWETFIIGTEKHHLNMKPPTQKFYTHTLDLTKNAETIFAGFRSNTKRNIKKAIREGIHVEISNSKYSMKKFFRLYAITRKRLGTAIGPYRLFENTYKHAISDDKGFIVCASYKQKIIAAAIYLHFGKNVIFQHGASDTRYHHLRPNNLVMWETIKWYAQNGFESLSFGITPINHAGLRNYKSGMSTSEQVLSIYVYDLRKCEFITPVKVNNYQKHRKTEILKRTPIPILKLWGKYVSKHNESYYG